MLPAARNAQFDFVRLVAEEPSSLYFEEFLRGGYDAWPRSYQIRYPHLATWPGVRGLKARLRRVVGAARDRRVLLAGRSLALMRLGARQMFRRCKRVLTTDLSWPTYEATIVAQAKRHQCAVIVRPLRVAILHRDWSAVDVVRYLVEEFIRSRCDGLCLTAVDHLGVRLPIAAIVQAIRNVADLRYTLIDAAQAFCHVPLADVMHHADFVVAGTHKWLGAYLPLGIGFVRSNELPRVSPARRQRYGRPRNLDPILSLTESLCRPELGGYGETASVAALFACAAAADGHAVGHALPRAQLGDTPLEEMSVEPPDSQWRPVRIATELTTRIHLFQNANKEARHLTANMIRRQWLDAGMIVTGYHGGLARVAFPIAPALRTPLGCSRRRPLIPSQSLACGDDENGRTILRRSGTTSIGRGG